MTIDNNEYLLAPLFPGSDGTAVSLHVLARRKQDPVAGWFVPLYRLADANVFLGCLCDSRRDVKEWLEIWVQTGSRSEHHGIARDPLLNNAFLDQKWRQRSEVLQNLAPQNVYAGPWQDENIHPIFFSTDDWTLANPHNQRAEGSPAWVLCKDDALLKNAGLQAYTESTFRYFHNPPLGSKTMFVSLNPAAPRNQRVLIADAEAGYSSNLAHFNPEAGLMFIRKHAPFSVRDFKKILEGHGWQGSGQAARKIFVEKAYEPFGESSFFQNNHGLIFSGKRGFEGRILECFLLKLMLFQEVLNQTAAAIKAESRPFLNLLIDHFRVHLPEGFSRLPACWNFEVTLARTSETIALEIEDGAHRFFSPVASHAPTIYQPKEMLSVRGGHGTVRIREVHDDRKGGPLKIEGNLADVGVKSISPSELIWLELPVKGERLSFYARALPAQNMADREMHFETLPRNLPGPLRDALSASKGISFDVPFNIHPVTSSPSDMYSLAVIGLEILLDNEKVSLAVALDECLSLARQIAIEDNTLPLPIRRARVVEAEPRFRISLGSQNICKETLEQSRARSLIPAELWWGFLDILVRMFPGPDPACWARDLGDVNAFAPESCLAGPQLELSALIERTRSLLFMDWTSNREVRKVLDDLGNQAE